MAGEEVPEKVRKADAIRYHEYWTMVKMERKLQRKILEDLGPRPDIPEQILHPVRPGRHSIERCGTCDPYKAQDCGSCGSCLEEGPIITRVQNRGTLAPGIGVGAEKMCDLAKAPSTSTVLVGSVQHS